MKKYILFPFLFTLFFSACSTKKVYEPIQIDEEWSKYESSDETIVDKSINIALLDNSKVLVKDGILDVKIKESHRAISHSDGWVISASIDGELQLTSVKDSNVTEVLELKKTIASASVNGDTLAVLFADNEIALYSIASKKVLFKELGGKS